MSELSNSDPFDLRLRAMPALPVETVSAEGRSVTHVTIRLCDPTMSCAPTCFDTCCYQSRYC